MNERFPQQNATEETIESFTPFIDKVLHKAVEDGVSISDEMQHLMRLVEAAHVANPGRPMAESGNRSIEDAIFVWPISETGKQENDIRNFLFDYNELLYAKYPYQTK